MRHSAILLAPILLLAGCGGLSSGLRAESTTPARVLAEEIARRNGVESVGETFDEDAQA